MASISPSVTTILKMNSLRKTGQSSITPDHSCISLKADDGGNIENSIDTQNGNVPSDRSMMSQELPILIPTNHSVTSSCHDIFSPFKSYFSLDGVEVNAPMTSISRKTDLSTDDQHIPQFLALLQKDGSLTESSNRNTSQPKTWSFTFDGIEVESAISMSWRPESSINSRKSDGSGDAARDGTKDRRSSSEMPTINNNGVGQRCCVPSWLRDAPIWIRCVVYTSLFVLTASFILVVSTIAIRRDHRNAMTGASYTNSSPGKPTSPPSHQLSDTSGQVTLFYNRTTTKPSTNKSSTYVKNQTRSPTRVMTLSKTLTPHSNGTFMPMISASSSILLVMSRQYTNITDMAMRLQSLPSNKNTVGIFHLGNWNDPNDTLCDNNAYVAVVKKYQGSPVPAFFIPGENESNNCRNQEAAWGFWKRHLLNYSQTYQNFSQFTLSIEQQSISPENFCFVRSGVLYIGVHLVGGNITNQTEWTLRTGHDLTWIDDSVNKYKDFVKFVIIFGSSGPSTNNSNNDSFFSGLRSLVMKYNTAVVDPTGRVRILPFAYIHDSSSTCTVTQRFLGISNFIRVNVEGNKWPPMRAILDPVKNSITFDQNNWLFSV